MALNEIYLAFMALPSKRFLTPVLGGQPRGLQLPVHRRGQIWSWLLESRLWNHPSGIATGVRMQCLAMTTRYCKCSLANAPDFAPKTDHPRELGRPRSDARRLRFPHAERRRARFHLHRRRRSGRRGRHGGNRLGAQVPRG